VPRVNPLLSLAQERTQAVDQPLAPSGDLSLGHRELGSQQERELRLGPVEGKQRLGAQSSPLASIGGVLTAARDEACKRIGGGIEGGVQAVGDVVEIAVESARGDPGAGRDPLRGGAEAAVLIKDVCGAAEQAPALVLGDGCGREPMATAGQTIGSEAIGSGQS
jgi:hypothetical protein